jgi:rare lipoprotein A (peptidoglycan hydrolase)
MSVALLFARPVDTARVSFSIAPSAAMLDAGSFTATRVLGLEVPPPDVMARPVTETSGVVASYFGPGLWENRTACGHVLSAGLLGVAHRTLPCGSLVTLRYGSRSLTVPVVDRGPFNYLREFDLTYAAKVELGCPDLCRLDWVR